MYSDAQCSLATSNANNTASPYAARSLVGVEGGLISEFMVSSSNLTQNKFSGETTPNKQGINTSTSNTAGIGQQFPTPGLPLPDLSSSYLSSHHSSLAQLNPSGQGQKQPQHRHGASNIPNSPRYSQQTQQQCERAHRADVFSLTLQTGLPSEPAPRTSTTRLPKPARCTGLPK